MLFWPGSFIQSFWQYLEHESNCRRVLVLVTIVTALGSAIAFLMSGNPAPSTTVINDFSHSVITAKAFNNIHDAAQGIKELELISEKNEKSKSLTEKKLEAAYYSGDTLSGYWVVKKNNGNCSGLFLNSQGGVMISGNKDSASLIFVSDQLLDLPDLTPIQATLTQTGTTWQQRTAIYTTMFFRNKNELKSTIAFAVPGLAIGVSGMLEEHNFKVIYKMRTLVNLTWQNGTFIRKEMLRCLRELDSI